MIIILMNNYMIQRYINGKYIKIIFFLINNLVEKQLLKKNQKKHQLLDNIKKQEEKNHMI